MNRDFFFSTNLQKWKLFKPVRVKAVLAHVAGRTGFYLTEEERLFSIGSNADGCLGVNACLAGSDNPIEITTLKGKKIIKINSLVSPNCCTVFVLTEYGEIYFWGTVPKEGIQCKPKLLDLRGTCEDIEILGYNVFIKNRLSPSHWYCINWLCGYRQISAFPDINKRPLSSIAAGLPYIIVTECCYKISVWENKTSQSMPSEVASYRSPKDDSFEKIAAGNWFVAALLKSGSIAIYFEKQKNNAKEHNMKNLSIGEIKFNDIIAEKNNEMLVCLFEGGTYLYIARSESLKFINCISPIEVFASGHSMPTIFRDSGINFGPSTSRPENCDFTAFFNCKETSDIKFVFLNSQELYGHKMILKKFSPHFKQMLSGDWSSDEIEIPWTLNVFNNYLKFVYCGKIDLQNHVELSELWQIADSYFEAELKSIIEKLLLDPHKLPVVPDCLCPICIFKNMIK